MAMGPDNEIYLTINKRILNMEAGDKILKNIEEIGKKPVKEIIPPTINQSQNKIYMQDYVFLFIKFDIIK